MKLPLEISHQVLRIWSPLTESGGQTSHFFRQSLLTASHSPAPHESVRQGATHVWLAGSHTLPVAHDPG